MNTCEHGVSRHILCTACEYLREEAEEAEE
jgi:hypothetical protein